MDLDEIRAWIEAVNEEAQEERE
jgi:hypothetical protein